VSSMALSGAGSKVLGHDLFQNFRRRQKLNLLPGKSPLVAALPAERRAALLAHHAFGYCDDGPTSVATGRGAATAADVSEALASVHLVEDGTPRLGSLKAADLQARRHAYEAQLAELDVSLAMERDRTQEISDEIADRQHEMAAVVDEHAMTSKALTAARARSAELAREVQRLLESLPPQDEPNAADADIDFGETACTAEGVAGSAGAPLHIDPTADVSTTSGVAGTSTTDERLALHRAYLTQLVAESRRLREECRAAEVR